MQGDLCAYMLQEYKERQDTARRSKQVAFTLPATMKTLDLGIPIVNIHPGHDGTVVTVREDGLVCHWSPELKPLRTKDMFVCFPLVYFTEYEKTKASKVLVCLSVLLPNFILESYNHTFLLSKKCSHKRDLKGGKFFFLLFTAVQHDCQKKQKYDTNRTNGIWTGSHVFLKHTVSLC